MSILKWKKKSLSHRLVTKDHRQSKTNMMTNKTAILSLKSSYSSFGDLSFFTVRIPPFLPFYMANQRRSNLNDAPYSAILTASRQKNSAAFPSRDVGEKAYAVEVLNVCVCDNFHREVAIGIFPKRAMRYSMSGGSSSADDSGMIPPRCF